MTTYAIHYVTGEVVGGFETTADALHALDHAHPRLYAGHDGDLADGGDRTLVWECETDSEDDDGENAFAEIRRERA